MARLSVPAESAQYILPIEPGLGMQGCVAHDSARDFHDPQRWCRTVRHARVRNEPTTRVPDSAGDSGETPHVPGTTTVTLDDPECVSVEDPGRDIGPPFEYDMVRWLYLEQRKLLVAD